jgi:hypothetical protein
MYAPVVIYIKLPYVHIHPILILSSRSKFHLEKLRVDRSRNVPLFMEPEGQFQCGNSAQIYSILGQMNLMRYAHAFLYVPF